MAFGLTQHGRREWLSATVAAAGTCALLAVLAVRVSGWLVAAMAVPLAVWLWVLWFFRDPERAVPEGEGLFVSPADGRVCDVTPVGPDSPLGREGVKVGVFMNVFDVHVNRSPMVARVDRVEHKDGLFLDVRAPDAAERNESTTIHMTHRSGAAEYPVVVRQIAGLIARRIVTALTERQELAAGERIGMIKFGSRVELFVPRELAGEVRVRVGQKVRAGVSVLISRKEPVDE